MRRIFHKVSEDVTHELTWFSFDKNHIQTLDNTAFTSSWECKVIIIETVKMKSISKPV